MNSQSALNKETKECRLKKTCYGNQVTYVSEVFFNWVFQIFSGLFWDLNTVQKVSFVSQIIVQWAGKKWRAYLYKNLTIM